ncbi:MAG: M14 family zinc carboxypeptidase [Methylococcales bacterium]
MRNPSKSMTEFLPELKQIEALIKHNTANLGAEVLSEIHFKQQVFPIYALTLGSKAKEAPCIVFVGGVHGLERIGTQVVLAFLETLLERLRWDLTLEVMLAQVRIVFLPLINPVGMFKHTRANGQGIDLMRNAPVDSREKTVWLAGGHRISARLPWYRGIEGAPMQAEAQILCDYIGNSVLTAPFSIVLDCHSGFGVHDRIWFPYAKSRKEPIKHLGEIYTLRKLFFQTYPYQNYCFEPQALHYLTHGDLWDHLYGQSLALETVFLPLTLEMGSWRWIRKNPLQLVNLLGMFHPIKQHRINRVLRGHLILMEFLVRATLSYQHWTDASQRQTLAKQAEELWYSGG